MQKRKGKQTKNQDILPDSFSSISEAATFWDNHDSGDHEDIMEDVEFQIDIRRRVFLVPIAGHVLDCVREKAKSQGISTETLVNLLLQEHAQ